MGEHFLSSLQLRRLGTPRLASSPTMDEPGGASVAAAEAAACAAAQQATMDAEGAILVGAWLAAIVLGLLFGQFITYSRWPHDSLRTKLFLVTLAVLEVTRNVVDFASTFQRTVVNSGGGAWFSAAFKVSVTLKTVVLLMCRVWVVLRIRKLARNPIPMLVGALLIAIALASQIGTIVDRFSQATIELSAPDVFWLSFYLWSSAATDLYLSATFMFLALRVPRRATPKTTSIFRISTAGFVWPPILSILTAILFSVDSAARIWSPAGKLVPLAYGCSIFFSYNTHHFLDLEARHTEDVESRNNVLRATSSLRKRRTTSVAPTDSMSSRGVVVDMDVCHASELQEHGKLDGEDDDDEDSSAPGELSHERKVEGEIEEERKESATAEIPRIERARSAPTPPDPRSFTANWDR